MFHVKQSNPTTEIYLKTKDFLVTGESFELRLNSTRDMLFTYPRPEEKELLKYYESENYISHTDSEKGLLSNLYQRVKRFAIKRKVSLITKTNSGNGSLLDIGAGTGSFLEAAKSRNWIVSGSEPNIEARILATNKGVELVEDYGHFRGRQFDVVTMWHVLEHIHDLENAIDVLSTLVKPNGHLIIAVPNYKSYDAGFYKNFWAAYDTPRHLWHFSRNSIERLFNKNFKLKKMHPMIFDSFYVSLLSEKYKTGSKFSIRAILVGGWSNLRALFTKEYSSRIYILQKSK